MKRLKRHLWTVEVGIPSMGQSQGGLSRMLTYAVSSQVQLPPLRVDQYTSSSKEGGSLEGTIPIGRRFKGINNPKEVADIKKVQNEASPTTGNGGQTAKKESQERHFYQVNDQNRFVGAVCHDQQVVKN